MGVLRYEANLCIVVHNMVKMRGGIRPRIVRAVNVHSAPFFLHDSGPARRSEFRREERIRGKDFIAKGLGHFIGLCDRISFRLGDARYDRRQ